ncbi:MAG: HD domain-containing protein [Candidatus Omnitrophota bacterium]|nr:HD domain-containing protein [Candidatus Omnitrophota bacterium]
MDKGPGKSFEKGNMSADEELKKAYKELKDSHIEMIFRLALVAEFRDPAMGTHLVRIADYSRIIAEGLGLPEEDVEVIGYASPMHDVGKVMLPDTILKKKGILTREEIVLMRRHPIVGADVFKNAKSSILQACGVIALTHHEWFDGSGYPRGLEGEQIPLCGRIVALADCFDAYTTERPYKKAFSFEVSVSMVRERSGSHFDPSVVRAFMSNEDMIKQVWEANRDIDSFIKHMGIGKKTAFL